MSKPLPKETISKALLPYVIPGTEDDATQAVIEALQMMLFAPGFTKACLAHVDHSMEQFPTLVEQAKKDFAMVSYGTVGAAILTMLTIERPEGGRDGEQQKG